MEVVLIIKHIDDRSRVFKSIKEDFVTDWGELIEWGFTGFYDNIKKHLKTDQNIGVGFGDEEGDMVPIESEDEYSAFIKFLIDGDRTATIYVVYERNVVDNAKGAAMNSEQEATASKKSVKFSQEVTALGLSDNEDICSLGLPAPITPEQLHTADYSQIGGITLSRCHPPSSPNFEYMIIHGKSTNKSKKKCGKNKYCLEKAGSRASARFVAGVEKNVDAVMNKVAEKCSSKKENQSGNSNPEGGEVPTWLKQYLAEFRENLLQEVNFIVKEQCLENMNTAEKNAKAKADESTEKDIEMNNTEASSKYCHRQISTDDMLKKLESIQKREKHLDDRMQRTKTKKLKILEKVNANRNRMSNPKNSRIFLMGATILGDEEPLRVKKDSRFIKVWQIMNSGYLPWTDKTELRLTWGCPGLDPENCVVACPLLDRGQVGSISVTFKGPSHVGTYKSFWHFFHMGEKFGSWVSCHIIVEPESEDDKNERNIEGGGDKAGNEPGSDFGSETDSDNEDSSDSIAVIDDDNHDEDAGFVVVPMPPCFFPDKPQDSAVKVVMKSSKKCDPSQEIGRDQTAEPSNGRENAGFMGKLRNQYMKKLLKQKLTKADNLEASKVPKDENVGSMGCSQTKPLDMTVKDIMERAFTRTNAIQSEAEQTSDNLTEYENLCNRLRQNLTTDDSRACSEKPADEPQSNASEIYNLVNWEHYKEAKKFYDEYASVARPTQYGIPPMVPEMAGHNFGLPQHPFNPVQARYPVPPMPFQAGFINPPVIHRANIIVPAHPPLAHPHPPLGVPHGCALAAAAPPPPPPPPPAPHHPVMFPPPPPPPIPLDLANSIYFQPSPYGGPMAASNHSHPQDEDDATSFNIDQDLSSNFKYGDLYYNYKGAEYLENSKKSVQSGNSSFSCNPVDLSNRPAKFESTANESAVADDIISTADPAYETSKAGIPADKMKSVPKCSLTKMLVDKKLTKVKKSKIGVQRPKTAKPKTPKPKAVTEDVIEESVYGRNIAGEWESSSGQLPAAKVEETESAAPGKASASEFPANEHENQPYVDILPESLVNGVISVVNSASSACSSALNYTRSQNRKHAQQPVNSVTDNPKFETSIVQLYEMGFYNYEKNCRLLQQYNFDMDKVVSHYCSKPNEL